MDFRIQISHSIKSAYLHKMNDHFSSSLRYVDLAKGK